MDIEAEITGDFDEILSANHGNFSVGDFVAHADPYMVASKYHGVVEQIVNGDVVVRWQERKGKTNELETYRATDLKQRSLLEPTLSSLQVGMCVLLKESPAKFCMPGDFWEIAGIRGEKIKVSLNGRGELIDSTASNIEKILP